MTSRAMILWAKAEADWLAGRAAEALQTADRVPRRCPSRGFPSHIMVEPVRQFAALDLGSRPGRPAERRAVPQLRRRQQGVAGDRRDVRTIPEARENCRAGSSPPCEELGPHLAAQLRAVRVGGRPKPRAAPATPTARSRSCACPSRAARCRAPSDAAAGARDLRLLGESVRPHSGYAIPPLTAAQVEVLDLVGRGLDTRAISRRLVVSETTVETHVRQSMQRLGVSTRLAAAVELVRRRGDVMPPNGATSTSRWARSNRSTSRRPRSTSSTCRSHRGRSIPRWSRAWWFATTTTPPRGHRRVPRRLGRGRDRAVAAAGRACRAPRRARTHRAGREPRHRDGGAR